MNFHYTITLIKHHFYVTKASFLRMLSIIYLPIFDLLIWGFVSTYFIELNQNLRLVGGFIVGAYIFGQLVSRLQQEISMPLMDNIWDRSFKNILISPVGLDDLSLSLVLFAFLKLLFLLIILFSIAYFFFSFDIFEIGPLIVPSIFNLLLFGLSFGVFVNGIIFRFGGKVSYMTWSLSTALQPFLCIFYSRDTLPYPLKEISFLFPPSYVFEDLRQIFFGAGGIDIGNLILPFLLNLVYLFLSYLFLVTMFRLGRKKGNFVWY